MTTTLVVLPTYQERDTLPAVVAGVLRSPVEPDVLVVDDDSPDGTGQLADDLAARHPQVHVLHRPAKTGLGPAYRAGYAWGLLAGYRRFVSMDADRSHDPAQLERLVAAAERADVVVGSRYVAGGRIERWPRHRRALSRVGNRYVRAATGVPVHDATSGYRVVRAAVLEAIGVERLRSDGYAFQIEVVLRAWRAGFHVEEVPIVFTERRAGSSKLSRAVVREAVRRTTGWAFDRPRRPAGRHPASVVVRGAGGGEPTG